MPELYGSVTPSAAAVATAASTALPPSWSTSRPMALADASTDETAPPYPVEVDGAGGVGRPVPTAEALGPAAGAAEAGAPTPTIPSAKAAVTAMPARRTVKRRSSSTMGNPPKW